MVYLIYHNDVSPDALRSSTRSDSLTLQRVPGQLNMSHAECTSGWLGTTCDVSEIALGEFSESDIDAILTEVADREFAVDRELLAAWLARSDGADDAYEEFKDFSRIDEVHKGRGYRFVIQYTDNGHELAEFEILPGHVMLDSSWDGYGSDGCTHDRAYWERVLDAGQIPYEIAEYSHRDSGGYVGFWALFVTDADADRSRAAMARDVEAVDAAAWGD